VNVNQNARILIVDDEPHLRHLSSYLLRRAGYEVVEASTGQDCLRMVQEGKPDLVLLDVILPDMGGLEVCRQIKSDARLADVYVLLLSAFKTASEDQAEGLEAGAEGYIVRPISNRELVARVESLLHLKWAKEALHRYADRLRVLHEIDQAVLAARSAEEIAEAALRHMRKLVPCMRASVAMFDADQGMLLAADCVGEARAGKGAHFHASAFDTQALAQGEVLSFTDIQDLSHPSPLLRALQADGVRSCISVPLIAGAELMGSLNLGADSPGPFAPEHMEIAREVAGSLAIGIQQTRLYEQVRQHTVELERHVAERTAELRASEMRFRTLFEQAAIGIALVDGEGRLAGSNPALQEMLGYSGEELLGKALTDLIHPSGEGTPAVDQHRELMDGQQDTYGTERRYVRKDGRLVWVNLTASVVRAEGGNPQFAIHMMEDITKKKRTQAALLQAEKLAIAGKLAASLTHEISNPLQSVIGCLGLAEEALAEGEGVDRYLQVALQELRRVARIVARLRNLHRPSQPEERVPTDVNALLERALSLSRRKCQDHGVEVDWRAATDLPPLPLATDQMQQVFLNLLLNAVEAMPQGGRLRMSTNRTHQPAGVHISFEDDGAGIANDVLPHIFDPFYSTKPEGLGLGLFTSLDIVEQHGGHINVESEVGKGTRFKVWLPT
jgi:PAS domain S-box-containing protein